MKLLSLFRLLIIFFFSINSIKGFSQTNTSISGNWSTPGNWSAGVPVSGDIANVNHAMTMDVNLSISGGGYYTINSNVTDAPGGTAYTLDLTGSSSNGTLEVIGNMTIEGACNVNSKGEIIVRNGATLTIGAAVFANGCFVTVDPGGTLIINGNVTNNNNSTGIAINGNLIVNGNFDGGNGSALTGSGSFTATGTITTSGSGTVFGSQNDCSASGGCSGNDLCGFTNTITAAQTICTGQTPATLNGSTNAASPVYLWESCTTSAIGTFATVSGTSNAATYSPGALTADMWYRRRVTSGGCSTTTAAIKITVSAYPTATISAGGATTFCSGCSVTLTSSAGSSYSWSTGATSSSISVNTTGSYTVTVANAVGCQTTSSATTVTVNSCPSHTWTGSTSSAWSTASNWNKCAAPGTTDDVTVPNVTTAPVISATASCKNLTINASASLTINSGNTLNIYGNITNNGTYTANGTSVLTGSGTQSVTGAVSFKNLTLNNTLGATLNNATTVNGILTLTSGTLASGGNLTVNLNTGAIDGSGIGSISGNITVVKTVNSNKYHMISSPLNGMTVNDWNDDITIKSGNYANLFTYDETNPDTTIGVGWTPQTSLATALTPMKGFTLYFYGATTLDHTGPYIHNAIYTSPLLTNTVSNVLGTLKPASDGWNLVGNPYPSAIDWNAASGWTKTGIDNAIYCWDAANSRYTSYVGGIGTNGGTQYIPSMQGFWLHVSSPGTGSVAMTNSVRVTSANPAIWRTAAASNVLKLTANSGSFSDETIIRFQDDAQEIFDSELDAYKMDNEDNTPNLYTELHNDQFSVNTLPYTFDKMIVPVKLKAGFTGAYTFNAEEIESFNSGDSIIFEDRLLGLNQDLRTNPAYTCYITAGDTSGRFYIGFRKSNLTSGLFNLPITKPSMVIKGVEDQIHVRFLNETSTIASIGIYNIIGQEVFKVENADISSKEYSIRLSNVQNGVYVIKIATDTQSLSSKMYLLK